MYCTYKINKGACSSLSFLFLEPRNPKQCPSPGYHTNQHLPMLLEYVLPTAYLFA